MQLTLGVTIYKNTSGTVSKNSNSYKKICYNFSFFLNMDQTIHVVTSNTFLPISCVIVFLFNDISGVWYILFSTGFLKTITEITDQKHLHS